MLELHRQNKEFVAVFDHHDDLVLFVGEGEEAELSFYQIKTTHHLNWTAKRLAQSTPKGELPKSIIGKAYYNIAQFGPEIRRACILSNRPLKATPASSEKETLLDGELTVADLCEKDKKALFQALEADFSGAFDSSHSNLLSFERVPYDKESYRLTVMGQITKLLEELHPDFVACSSPFYEALLASAGECTGNKTKSGTVEELQARVSLNRNDISKMIHIVQNRSKNAVEWWPVVHDELAKKGKMGLEIQRTKNKCLSYTNARRSGEKAALDLSASISNAISHLEIDEIDSVFSAIALLNISGLCHEPPSESYDLQAAMIVEVMEAVT